MENLMKFGADNHIGKILGGEKKFNTSSFDYKNPERLSFEVIF